MRDISGSAKISETDFGYTGQRDYGEDFGLMDYKARFYSPLLGRFTQPDSIYLVSVTQTLNRFCYVSNNPLKYNDPTGHVSDGNDDCIPSGDPDELRAKANDFIDRLKRERLIRRGRIRTQYRPPEEAHEYSTAYSIASGNIGKSEIEKTPEDSDGNIWYPDDVKAICIAVSHLPDGDFICETLMARHAVHSVPEIQQKWGLGLFIARLSPAFEGYPSGDPRRDPNSSDLPVSAHVFGLAVDIDVEWNYENLDQVYKEWDPVIDAIAAEYGLYRPLHEDESRRKECHKGFDPEWWHFELLE